MEHSSDILVFVSMSEGATTKLVGLSVSGIFLVMLMLNAVTYRLHRIGVIQSLRLERNAGS